MRSSTVVFRYSSLNSRAILSLNGIVFYKDHRELVEVADENIQYQVFRDFPTSLRKDWVFNPEILEKMLRTTELNVL